MPTPRRQPPRGLTRVHAITVAVLLAMTLAACGSQLKPEEVNAANGSASGTGTGTGTDPGTTGTDPGTAGGDPGTTGGDPGTTGGDPGTTGGDPGTTGGDPGSAGGDPGDTGGDPGDTGEPPIDVPSAADCEGFKNQTGITDDTIVIGNASDISGPAPGLFAQSQDAMKAFVQYFNSTVPDGICGRKLELRTYDSKTDAGADQQAAVAACKEVFAMVGSTSAFDLGGAKTTQDCGLPDIRAGSLTFERNACTTCYAAQAVNTNFFENAVPDFVKSQYGTAAGQKAAYFYLDAGASAQNAKAQIKAMTKRGMKFPVVQGIPTSDFNYVPYVQQMKDNDIEVVFFTAAYEFSVKMVQAMQQQGFKPKVYLRDPTDYNPKFVSQAGSAGDGTVVFTNFAPFEEANKESDLYEAYLKQVNPSADPLFFGVFAWSAARLFVTLASELGGGLTRASLISEVKKVDDWTANDLHAPQPVGSKGTGECWRFIQLNGGVWKPIGGTKYTCNGVTATN